jgi:REP-associated tyrosine transposase
MSTRHRQRSSHPLLWASQRSSVELRSTGRTRASAPTRFLVMTFYRRNSPHLQRDSKRHFVTFVTKNRWILPDWARDIVLACILHDDKKHYDLQAAVVMPDHAHLILIPLIDEPHQRVVPLHAIMKAIKGASAHKINQRLERHGTVWQEESFERVLRSSEDIDA